MLRAAMNARARQMSLLDAEAPEGDAADAPGAAPQPLASRMRPRTLEEFVGQEHLVGPGKLLRSMIERDEIPSMILWGPPGVGKTTLANVIANLTKAQFVPFSAVTSGIKEIKEIMGRAEEARALGVRTVLFVDEIHRFNKAQQDAFLPFVEQGSIVLIGATTENPSFEVNSALLSRCKVFVLNGLGEEEIVELLRRALTDERGYGGRPLVVPEPVLRKLAVYANGDARKALGTLETAVANAGSVDGVPTVTDEVLAECISRKALLYDKDGEEHYNIISALHKSMRNSDPDAAVYWLARMLEGGEDPLYVARRCIRFASEDVGLADPNALLLANTVWDTCHKIGMPECNCALTQTHADRRLPRARPEVQRDGRGLPRRREGRAGARRRAGAAAHPQRADAAHEGPRLRQGLHLRARHGGEDRADVVPAGLAPRPPLLRPGRPRRRSEDEGASRGRPRLARGPHRDAPLLDRRLRRPAEGVAGATARSAGPEVRRCHGP